MSKRSLLNIVVFSSVLLTGSVYAKNPNLGNSCSTPAATNSNGAHVEGCGGAKAVPELDASSGLIALGLIAGFVTLIRERRKLS